MYVKGYWNGRNGAEEALRGLGYTVIPAFACAECGGPGDRLSLVDAAERTVAVTCSRHNRYDRISWDVAIRDYPQEIKALRRRIEDRLRKDNEFLLRAADALDN